MSNVTDPKAMRALAHPVRMSLLEYLGVHGPATATQCAEALGESQANCSFHLRQLAKYGFVEESPSEDRRERPWRLVADELSVASEHADPEASAASHELSVMFYEREMAGALAFKRHRAAHPERWRRAAVSTAFAAWLTPEELEEIGAALLNVLLPYERRHRDPAARPEDARPVRFLLLGYPMSTPPAGEQ